MQGVGCPQAASVVRKICIGEIAFGSRTVKDSRTMVSNCASALRAASPSRPPMRTSRASNEENSMRDKWLMASSPAGKPAMKRSTLLLVASCRMSGARKLVSK
jgi:hypothetical protein